MNKKTDILIIGSGPAGVGSAMTARKYYPSKKITVITNVQDGVIPCGIPYMFASLNNPEENILPLTGLLKNNIEVVYDSAVNINRKEKILETKSNNNFSYEKLVLAMGSNPLVFPIKGIDKQGVYQVKKELGYLTGVIEKIKTCKNVLVIGGGFIGVEFADELSKLKEINVTLVEMLPNLLANSFDVEFSQMAETRLKEKGVNVLTNTKIDEILGDEKVQKVRFTGGKEIEVDGIILGVGAKPNVEMALNAGLEKGKCGGILTDEYMRTCEDSDIFAVGDCACKKDFFTHKYLPVMLASTAGAEARIAGANLYEIQVIRENKGTIAIYSTYIDGLVLGAAGLTENTAIKEGFKIVVSTIDGFDKHPITLPGACKSKLKLIFSENSGIILGGQVSCGMSCAQMINIIGLAIQKRMTYTELETMQIATHPYLTSGPTIYPITLAAQNFKR